MPCARIFAFPHRQCLTRCFGFRITSPVLSFQDDDIDQPAVNGEDRALVRSHGERLSQVYLTGDLIAVVSSDYFPFKLASVGCAEQDPLCRLPFSCILKPSFA